MNDVTKRGRVHQHGERCEVPGLEARPCLGRLDQADQPDGRVAPLLSCPCGQSVPHRTAYRIVAAVAVPVFSRCAVVVLRSATDFGRFVRLQRVRPREPPGDVDHM